MLKKHVHMIGIKGVGMAALAVYLSEMGYKVTGSDLSENFVTDKVLNQKHIKIKNNFEIEEKIRPDLVIVTGAHGGMTNPEALTYASTGVKVMTHGEALGFFMKDKFGISVAGVGGKTTTSAMIASILSANNYDPSYVVGVGEIFPLGAPGHFGKSKYFVAEADEYACCPVTNRTPRFLYQKPNIGIITNIELDHPDLYRNINETISTFQKFISQMPRNGTVIINGDNVNNQRAVKQSEQGVLTYGLSEGNDYQITNINFRSARTSFCLRNKNIVIGEFELKVPGVFNILNASASIVCCLSVGLSAEQTQKGIGEFLGTKRRFELIAEKNQIKLYDDYAHHPSEIKMALRAVKEWFPGYQIVCLFQPHTYSRTKTLFGEFARSFSECDRAFILPIFPSAREKEDKTINSMMLVNEIRKYNPNVHFINTALADNRNFQEALKPKTIILTMGAGDLYKMHDQLISLM